MSSNPNDPLHFLSTRMVFARLALDAFARRPKQPSGRANALRENRLRALRTLATTALILAGIGWLIIIG
ncbi:hypothetical protein [Sinorhizobium sp. BG8]|uniref:hypothetical protein n=1 Tax=Sinorhizobium sp. BG8 TaxID=2613773 RepID=UPI00193E427D|nr:hypothetical protein [Sinorhizobium sp. BG8]QRM55215.1 hypothetical protein F3Y30_12215 [Sinorhizobium sp. BG8]